ncbi:putative glycosomal membrane protein [Leishmania major strain Friedlin]|uniref:Putative glycosomal membrane protein n=1 Tax=Leishmania major TaxID=5664 RepID=Q4Q838_LEIMA|nr:putative glycosomal membrane protein [Leishmania major strain Friedlin]CAG9577339.1 glycosomal_membrane_protein_-_putative [Leishmania major strain Friedlin]CAJ05682.1 putative glycosomal membrane protein [Leishmania major strain Friedlin]|eukprot:XP_001684510.1 putative glycosomal membrane protein [Leishmania major strain Friedlin]
MSDFEKLIKLLGQTDGRDKIYKLLAGLFKILAAVAASSQDSRAKAYVAIGNSIGSARSLMRMGKFVSDVPKMQKIADGVVARGFAGTECKKFIEFLRIIGNSLYIMGDNAAFMAKHKLVPADAKCIVKYAKTAQFWGFFLAAVLDLIALRAALQKRVSDVSTSKKEAKAAVISLTKDASDVLVTMAAVGYLKSLWSPSPITAGALTCVSGGVATYLNWSKIK